MAVKNKTRKMLTLGLVILMGLALLLSFSQVADWVGVQTNQNGDMIRDIARTVLAGSIGIYLISAGVAALAVPVVGIILITVGLAILAYAVWPYFQRDQPAGE